MGARWRLGRANFLPQVATVGFETATGSRAICVTSTDSRTTGPRSDSSAGTGANSGKALRRTIRRSAREGGSGCDFRLSRGRNHLASRWFRRRRLPTVLAVSGSMVQNRKSARKSGQNKILELRSQRQADAANPSEWTQAGLAQKVGASVRSVKAWEAGDTLPRLFYRRRLAKALSVSVSDLGF